MTRLDYRDLSRLLDLMTGDGKHDAASSSTLDVLWVLYRHILRVGPDRIDAMAAVLAAFHAAATRAGAGDGYGTAAQIVSPALGNFDQITALGADPGAAARQAAHRQADARE